jgi:flagellar hook protein FlgE
MDSPVFLAGNLNAAAPVFTGTFDAAGRADPVNASFWTESSVSIDRTGLITGAFTNGTNVVLAQEFTSMIVAQRGFQATSRVTTNSDEMLQEVVNLMW